jgi:L-asparaginase II
MTPEGRLVARLGDPRLATFTRSAAKPFQCLPLLLAGGEARFGLDAADLALICASHGGTPEHTERAASLLARGGFSAGDLLCGAHPPLDRASARRLREEGSHPTTLHNNCSGKHAGMLLACRLLDMPAADYVSPQHPLQRRILAQLAPLCAIAEEAVGVGIDGCGAPTFHMPLASAAQSYAALAHPEAAGLGGDLAAALHRVVAAMTGEPRMVAGPGRFTTRLMEATRGRVLGKEGAEGFYGVAVRGPVALGIAIKVADGGERCRDGVVLDVLRQTGSLSGDEATALAEFQRTPLLNWRGLSVGEVTPELELEEVVIEAGGSPVRQ